MNSVFLSHLEVGRRASPIDRPILLPEPTADQLRGRAWEYLDVAATTQNSRVAASLLRLAEGYQRVAAQLECELALNPAARTNELMDG